MERPLFFLIDDDELFTRLNERYIRKFGLSNNIQSFSDASNALIALQTMEDSFDNAPDLILLDLNMPGLDGWRFLEEYSKLPATLIERIKLFVCSSTVNPEEMLRAGEHPLTAGFISKPINKDTIQLIKDSLKI